MSGSLEGGDKASSLENGNPLSTEVKAGESTVVSHRPNEISKPATGSEPAMPNNGVKPASEPVVGQNGHADKSEAKKDAPRLDAPKPEEKNETNGTSGPDAKAGEKRKADEKADAPVAPAESAAPPATESEPKKQKVADGTDKKKPGRPKGPGTDKPKKEKKEPRIGQALRKTRSQGTA